jgi:hypothetical protein
LLIRIEPVTKRGRSGHEWGIAIAIYCVRVCASGQQETHDHAKILDFGLAKLQAKAATDADARLTQDAMELTAPGSPMGTLTA